MVKWIDDEGAKIILVEIGLKYEDMVISAKDINKKLSAENRARKTSLDETRIDGLKASIKRGIPLPKLVVRRIAEGCFVVAGGNHRLAAVNGESTLPVHVIECTDSEFELVVRLLNGYVGEGLTKAERVESAADAVSRLGLTQKLAAELYGVSKNDIQMFVEHARATALLSTLNIKGATRFTKTHVKALGDLCSNVNVLRAAAQAATACKLTTEEMADLARVARKQPTEAAQVRVFEERLAVADKPEAVVPRKIKKRFMQSVNGLRALVGRKTWSSLEIKEDEAEAVKKQVQEVRDMLSCLLKAGG